MPSVGSRAPREFDDVLARALAKDPGERYPSAGDLGRAAAAAAHGQTTRELGHSVARGEAAPLAETTRLEPLQPTARVVPLKQKRARHALVELTVIAAFFLVAIVVTVVALTAGGSDPRQPLSSSDVAGAARGFANAYAREDTHALARLLAPDVQRVSASDVQRGRSAVVAAYRSQFSAQATRGYKLANLHVEAGAAGRAEATFTVTRSGRPPITGRVVFGVERRSGKALIRLIATESRS